MNLTMHLTRRPPVALQQYLGWWTQFFCSCPVFFALLTCSPYVSYARSPDSLPVDDQAMEADRSSNVGKDLWSRTRILPLVLYSPETALMIGGGTLTLIDLGGARSDRPSSFSLFGIYTTNQQVVLAAAYELRGRGDRHVVQQIARFVDWPDRFYGIGNQLDKGIEVQARNDSTRSYLNFTDRYLQLETEYLFQPLKSIYVGVGHHLRWSRADDIESSEHGEMLHDLEGAQPMRWSGFMPILAYDTRDRLFWPSSGLFLRGDVFVYRRVTGSHFDGTFYRLDGRIFGEVFKGQVAAARMNLQRATGDIPFQRLPALGGPDLFRGWYLGRLRDRALFCQQLEWRSELSNRMAIVSFVSAGRVAPTMASLTPADLRYAGGLGYRFALDIEQRAHLRLDLAYGAGLEFYFQFKEAF